MTSQEAQALIQALYDKCRSLEDRNSRLSLTNQRLKDALRDAEEQLRQFGAHVSFF